MMVPRSYPYIVGRAPSQRPKEKMGVPSRTASTHAKSMHPTPVRANDERAHRRPEPTRQMPAPEHSKPVVIPPRTPCRTGTAAATQTVKVRGHNGGRPHHAPGNHKPDAIPPAVAALLAVTAIPKMPPRRRKGQAMDKRISMDELIQEWRQDDSELPASVVGSPLDLLLGRVDESEEEYGSLTSMEQERDFSSPSVTSRSISSDSLSTIPPSLDTHAPSFASNWDEPSTPDSFRKSSTERREKLVSSPPAEDCILDHPLLHFNPDGLGRGTSNETCDVVASPAASSERFKSFKSNLTASLQALKSAAKSFSNFTAPSVPPDDLLTRSLLSPRFASEMRPKQVQGLPSAELRRYLNPPPAPISPGELSTQLRNALMMEIEEDSSAPMIQMQTYERRTRSSSRRRKAADALSDAARPPSASPAVRQREPRENSDFLRVIVLEMNMRRVGKLDAKAVGKARIWLPPRKSAASRPPDAQGRVPDRWVALRADDG